LLIFPALNGTMLHNYLNPGYKRDLFTKPVPNLKQNGKTKKLLRAPEMGSWRGVERGVAGFKVKNTRS
jgi:hypothetical protein